MTSDVHAAREELRLARVRVGMVADVRKATGEHGHARDLRLIDLALTAADERVATAERERDDLNERLENNRVYGMNGARRDVPPGSIPDGIECRDATISGQRETIDRLVAQRDEARGACGGATGGAAALQ